MVKNDHQRIIMNILGTRPIAFNSDLAHALGSAKAGLFLSQLLYWWGKGKDPNWIYKTIEDIKKETSLSRSEQDTAIRICKKYETIKVERKGIPAKRYFQIDKEKISQLLENYYSSLSENDKQDYKKKTNKIETNKQSNTDNTHINYNRDSLFLKKIENSKEKKRPFFRGMPIVHSKNKRWCIPKDGSPWLEFAGKEKDIDWL